KGFVNADLLNLLPDGAIVVNYARGAIVDEDAAIAALSSGRLRGYITDFPSRKTLRAPGVIATPHIGASTEESEENCAIMAAQELRSYLERGNVSHSVNFPTSESIPSGDLAERLIVINRDVPGMIGFASQAIGESGVNIASYLNESNGRIGYNIVDVASPIPPAVIEKIRAHPDVIRTRVVRP
ncbi:MAG: 3-phosphoglycerate dehydrogenase, partial [Planctomycetes bacterium]|nr:3-phosphoglycerate dehydrogenase [Planctomycetota bacterium]